jgi:hypothetical protein
MSWNLYVGFERPNVDGWRVDDEGRLDPMRALLLVIVVALILALGSLEVLASRSASITTRSIVPGAGP